MRLMDKKWIAALLILGITVAAPSFADGVGKVIRLNPSATVLREGKTIPLGVKDDIYLNDVIQTDKTGKVQVFFKDDSTVTIGKNSQAHMKEFVPDGKEPSFKLDMTKGAARIITGKIVEKNPNGFTVTTPDATIAIRGTILAIHAVDGRTSVFVENTLKQVFVNDILVPSGFKLVLSPDGSATPSQITDKDKEEIDAASTVASNAGNTSNTMTTATNTMPIGQNSLGNIPLAIQAVGDNDTRMVNLANATKTAIAPMAPPMIDPMTNPVTDPTINPVTPNTMYSHGYVSGSLSFANNPFSFSSGNFGFYVELKTGNVNQATMGASGGSGNIQSFQLSNGHGTLKTITGFSLTDSRGITGGYKLNDARMTIDTPTPQNVGDKVSGNYDIQFNQAGSGQGGNISGGATGTLKHH